jgi:GNAT superfamily N-acetyltransferase
VKPSQLPSAVVLPTLLTPGTRVLSLLAHVGATLWRARSTLRRALSTRAAATKLIGSGPSWYLEVIGTNPAYRGQGVARRLLEQTLERCDVEGLPAWLETTEYTNVPLYERFGFESVAASVPGSILPGLWVMRREPRPPS